MVIKMNSGLGKAVGSRPEQHDGSIFRIRPPKPRGLRAILSRAVQQFRTRFSAFGPFPESGPSFFLFFSFSNDDGPSTWGPTTRSFFVFILPRSNYYVVAMATEADTAMARRTRCNTRVAIGPDVRNFLSHAVTFLFFYGFVPRRAVIKWQRARASAENTRRHGDIFLRRFTFVIPAENESNKSVWRQDQLPTTREHHIFDCLVCEEAHVCLNCLPTDWEPSEWGQLEKIRRISQPETATR